MNWCYFSHSVWVICYGSPRKLNTEGDDGDNDDGNENCKSKLEGSIRND